MAKARHKTETTSSILQSLEQARQRFEETFQRAIQAVQHGGSPAARHGVKLRQDCWPHLPKPGRSGPERHSESAQEASQGLDVRGPAERAPQLR